MDLPNDMIYLLVPPKLMYGKLVRNFSLICFRHCTSWLLYAAFLFVAGNALHSFGHDLHIGVQEEDGHYEKCQYCAADFSSAACSNGIYFPHAPVDSVISFPLADLEDAISSAYFARAPPVTGL